MAVVFYVIGGVVIVIGALWATFSIVIAEQTGVVAASAFGILAALPGLGLALSGLGIVAVGGVLSRLDRIAENTESLRRIRQPPVVDTSRWSERDHAAHARQNPRREPT